MIELLQRIVCELVKIPVKLIDLVVMVVNFVIQAFGALAGVLVGLLPTFPDAPAPPSSGIIAYANWFVPLAPIIAAIGMFIVLWLVWLLLAIALRWVKAV